MGKLDIYIFFNFVVGIYFKASSEVMAVTMATGQLQEKDLYISGFQIISKLSGDLLYLLFCWKGTLSVACIENSR